MAMYGVPLHTANVRFAIPLLYASYGTQSHSFSINLCILSVSSDPYWLIFVLFSSSVDDNSRDALVLPEEQDDELPKTFSQPLPVVDEEKELTLDENPRARHQSSSSFPVSSYRYVCPWNDDFCLKIYPFAYVVSEWFERCEKI